MGGRKKGGGRREDGGEKEGKREKRGWGGERREEGEERMGGRKKGRGRREDGREKGGRNGGGGADLVYSDSALSTFFSLKHLVHIRRSKVNMLSYCLAE